MPHRLGGSPAGVSRGYHKLVNMHYRVLLQSSCVYGAYDTSHVLYAGLETLYTQLMHVCLA